MSEQMAMGLVDLIDGDKRWCRIATAAMAIAMALFLQWKMMAYYNYSLWRVEVIAIFMIVALMSSFAASLIGGLADRGRAWASSYVSDSSSWLYDLLSVLPAVAVRAAVMCACLSVANVVVVTSNTYREDVGFYPAAVLVRFLADYPQSVLVCLAVLYVIRWLASRTK